MLLLVAFLQPSTTHPGLMMHTLYLLSLVNGIPARFTIDRSYPHSSVSEAFLFQNQINPVLDSSECNCWEAKVSVPSVGGYYTSEKVSLLGSVVCTSDVILGVNWLSQCRPVANGNVFNQPSPVAIADLTVGHVWSQDGM